MNVTSSSTTAVMSGDLAASQASSKTNSNSKTTEKSFEEEMKTATKTEEPKETKESADAKTQNEQKDLKAENKDAKAQQKNERNVDDGIVPVEALEGEVNFTDFKYHNESQSLLSMNIQNLLNTKDLMNVINTAATVDYDSINMSDADANFFANLVQNTDMSMQGIMNKIGAEVAENANVQKSVQISSVLMEKLSESLKTNKPFRIDFDKDVSVIIRVNKDGSLSANFIPGDKAVEQYLRNNIASLRQRFDEENLQYSELSYSNSRQEKHNKRNNKENGNE